MGLRRRLPALYVLLAFISPLAAQNDDEEFPVYRPGLIGEYRAAQGTSCRRTDQALAFSWHGSSPDLRLPPGEFSVHWRGRLFSIEPGDYQLHVHAAGEIELHLNGQALVKAKSSKAHWHAAKPIQLSYGHHPLEIRYRSASGKASELALFWQGPRFQLEPVPAWHLFHDPAAAVDDRFEEGQRLARALRCDACHEKTGEAERLAAPSLARLNGNLERAWFVDWLSKSEDVQQPLRRMPHFSLDREQAAAIADYLFSASETHSAPTKDALGDSTRGERLFLTMGCLACHRVDSLGQPALFGGGDLTQVARKRPADFFARWLQDPARINASHRMPVFKLTEEERADLAVYLTTLAGEPTSAAATFGNGSRPDGRQLVAEHRCGACHELPEKNQQPVKTAARIHGRSDWSKSCLDAPRTAKRQPEYRLNDEQAAAIRAFFSQRHPDSKAVRDGAFVLEERNCIACHARGPEGGIAALLPPVVERVPELAAELPLLTAPSLLGVGDKLHEQALAAAISTRDGPLRPWLSIRMPRFNLADQEMEALVKHFVEQDRIPEGAPARPVSSLPGKKELTASGARLVTSDGFGCTSCHKIGDWMPKKVALNARGTELSVLGDRLRKPWFERWVRNPARIVPRMEMPSIVTPAKKILNENIDHQLAAVWHVLNQPDFTPPAPSAIRLVNTTNVRGSGERAQVLTDVLETDTHVFIRPLLIALPNRHNVLIDQETNTLAGWWTGDAALQRTRGKSWYWEPSGMPFWPLARPDEPDITLRIDGQSLRPAPRGQHVAPFDWLEHVPDGVRFAHRLRFRSQSRQEFFDLHVTQTFTSHWPEAANPASGFLRRVEVQGLPSRADVEINTLPGQKGNSLADRCSVQIMDGALLLTSAAPVCSWLYTTERRVDQAVNLPPAPALPSTPLHVVPGYEGVRLPLAEAEMPTALAWREDGTLIVCSLKGLVCLARDTDGDGLEDQLTPFSDELPAPYGAAVHDGAIDVITKFALLRLHDADNDGRADRTQVVASGWGHTADYHDWAVGIPRDSEGNYYVGLPCQQDDRTPAAAHLRGRGLKLIPRKPTADNPELYSIQPFCEGLRFPMGLALSRHGQLFATDNQGNYNPFNELNHLVPGRHYGFINKLEAKPGERPPLTAPAIDIPHPWTRSVNGICFLDTPPQVKAKLGRDVFGPHEGHLIGCEYDTRGLIRMSLQQVGDTWQGAAYPFTVPPVDGQEPLQGPICCAVSPAGDLYIGNLRDSGWGGSANIGSIARLRPTGMLPPGIAEVRAVKQGFEIDFTQPVDPSMAAKPSSYGVSSYRRISTSAYGGPDVDRESHTVRSVQLSGDRRRATLQLGELREGFIYELRFQNLAAAGEVFHPAEAHYTLRVAPR